MSNNEIFRAFLRDEEVMKKFKLTESQISNITMSDESAHIFINVIKACIMEYHEGKPKSHVNLKKYVDNNIPSSFIDDMLPNI